jgi:hypothetical protein
VVWVVVTWILPGSASRAHYYAGPTGTISKMVYCSDW